MFTLKSDKKEVYVEFVGGVNKVDVLKEYQRIMELFLKLKEAKKETIEIIKKRVTHCSDLLWDFGLFSLSLSLSSKYISWLMGVTLEMSKSASNTQQIPQGTQNE